MTGFYTLYKSLPQYGPGSDASTCKALGCLPDLPKSPRVFDLGCGCGRQTLVLARQLRTKVIAVDTHQAYLDELRESAVRQGLDHLVEGRCCSMDQLDEPENSIDLIWSEGAAYTIGVAQALALWRGLLKRGGVLGFTELTWLTDSPAIAAANYWRNAYPAMTTAAGNLALAEMAGYAVIDAFTLPAEDWWAYYRPLRTAMDKLRPRADEIPELAGVIRDTDQEIEMYERSADQVGYTFLLLQRR